MRKAKGGSELRFMTDEQRSNWAKSASPHVATNGGLYLKTLIPWHTSFSILRATRPLKHNIHCKITDRLNTT